MSEQGKIALVTDASRGRALKPRDVSPSEE